MLRKACILLFLVSLVCLSVAIDGAAGEYRSQWGNVHDRIWIGPACWPNPMEDWRIQDGRLECTGSGADRNVHLLTHQLADKAGGFSMSVRLGTNKQTSQGSAGFRVGIHDDINDYRGNVLWGKGIDAGITLDGRLLIAKKKKALDAPMFDDVTLMLTATPEGGRTRLSLTALATQTGRKLGQLTETVATDELIGNVALVNNFSERDGSLFWFADWRVKGERFVVDEGRVFGPILWSMYTLSDSRGPQGHVMKMTAMMPPLGEKDNRQVELLVKKEGQWKSAGKAEIDPAARTATFRQAHWTADQDVPYRLVYTMHYKDGVSRDYHWAGIIRREPLDRPLVLAGMTCQYHYGFPYTPLVRNLTALNPDLLYFSGDQIYEPNGHYGIIRTPADRSILNYLRKYYLFGWAFGDLMRDRPTLCTPDDHDVFQGNLWGNGGNPVTMKDHNAGGYAQPPAMVNVVHHTQTSHHPAFYDPTPIQQGISVYYGDMVYGRVSFAIISDRMFKSGPKNTVTEWGGRPDILLNTDYDVRRLDKPGLKLLGDRQLKFLGDWVKDWRGADMKMLLSQTVFSQVNTHTGGHDKFVFCDLDTGGWPQSARNEAIKIIRKGFPLHISGDQHLTSLCQYGVEQQRDGNWSFCTPAISVGWQRWWRPDELYHLYENRPAHDLPNTGEYEDSFGNLIYVYAVGNPEGSNHPHRYQRAHIKASGFGVVRVDTDDRVYTVESYRFLVDVTDDNNDDQFPGFPHRIKQMDNYGRDAVAWLPTIQVSGMTDPVIQIINEQTGDMEYALRINGSRFRPKVFGTGSYTVLIGDQDSGAMKTIEHIKSLPDGLRKILNVSF